MSYIRCFSNPEGFYIWCDVNNSINIAFDNISLTIPRYIFHGVMKRWIDTREDSKYRGAKILFSRDFKWELHYKNWNSPILMYEVTLFYIANNCEKRY